jgi:hypothetical protein
VANITYVAAGENVYNYEFTSGGQPQYISDSKIIHFADGCAMWRDELSSLTGFDVRRGEFDTFVQLQAGVQSRLTIKRSEMVVTNKNTIFLGDTYTGRLQWSVSTAPGGYNSDGTSPTMYTPSVELPGAFGITYQELINDVWVDAPDNCKISMLDETWFSYKPSLGSASYDAAQARVVFTPSLSATAWRFLTFIVDSTLSDIYTAPGAFSSAVSVVSQASLELWVDELTEQRLHSIEMSRESASMFAARRIRRAMMAAYSATLP